MGAFFSNIAVKTADGKGVENFLQGHRRTAYLTWSVEGWVMVYDKNIESDFRKAEDLAKNLSKELKTVVFSFMVHDSDNLFYSLYCKGKTYDKYISAGGIFDSKEATEDFPGRPQIVSELCGRTNELKEIKSILKRGYTFSEDQLREFAKTLGMPVKYIDWGYNYLDKNGQEFLGKEFGIISHIGKKAPPLSAPKVIKRFTVVFNAGDCLVFKLGLLHYGAALVLSRNEADISGSIVNRIAILKVKKFIKPTGEDIRKASVAVIVNCYESNFETKKYFRVIDNIKIGKRFNNSDYTYTSWRGIVSLAKSTPANLRDLKTDEKTVRDLIKTYGSD